MSSPKKSKSMQEDDPKSSVYLDVRKKVSETFPINDSSSLLNYIKLFEDSLQSDTLVDSARLKGKYTKSDLKSKIKEFSRFNEKGSATDAELAHLVSQLTGGAPRWRSPYLMYNVGAAVSTPATAAYTVALDENIFNINDGLAGNALVAENSVAKALSKLANLDTEAYGLFTFGGTATNLYAEKFGINKCEPDSPNKGLSGKIKIIVTEDCHFSHAVSADWLGIGKDNMIVLPAKSDRTSDIEYATKAARQALSDGYKIATIIINGGTTYSQTIDDIASFVALRDKLVKEYNLDYKPHIHVDSVIGWIWLWFAGYDFDINPLNIPAAVLRKINVQYDRIAGIKYADSWGIDFHKGLGGCPVDCSMIMINDASDLNYIAKNKSESLHQLASDFSNLSPVDFTLETSRSAGPALAALVAMHSIGIDGYRSVLAGMIEVIERMKQRIAEEDDLLIANHHSDGYVIMLRLLPPNHNVKQYTAEDVNAYNKSFYKWDEEMRMSTIGGVEYSFTSQFTKDDNGSPISALKLYPVSPHLTVEIGIEAIETIIDQKKFFDERSVK